MQRAIVYISLPGLSRALLEGGAMPEVARLAATGRRARLHPSFPCLPDLVDNCILRGVAAVEHGLRGLVPFRQALKAPAPPTLAARLRGENSRAWVRQLGSRVVGLEPPSPVESREDPWRGAVAVVRAWRRQNPRVPLLVMLRSNELDQALRDSGLASPELLAAAGFVDEAVGELARCCAPDVMLLIAGGPPYRSGRSRVGLEGRRDGFEPAELQVRGAVARVRLAQGQGEARDALLRLPGVERVLSGRALELWGAGHEAAGDLLVLAQEGWSFTGEAAVCGHPEAKDAQNAVVVAAPAAGRDPRPWPTAIHDLRLGPSMAQVLGLPLQDFGAPPLPV